MNAINSYYGWSRRVEAHKNASLNYAELYRFLSIEMGLPREERIAPQRLLKMVKDDYTKLQKMSPLVPPPVRRAFHLKFQKVEGITFPEELNGLEQITIYVPEKDTDRQKKLETPQGGVGGVSFFLPKESSTPIHPYPTPPRLLSQNIRPGEGGVVVKGVLDTEGDGGTCSESLGVPQLNEVVRE